MGVQNHDTRVQRDTLLDDVRSVAAEVEGRLTEREYARRGRFGVTTFRRRFGSWNAAKEAAGLEPISRDRIPEEELLADLRAVARQVDGSVSERVYAERGTHGPTTYRRRFGSWSAAKEAAGLPSGDDGPTPSDLLADLDRVAQLVDTDYVTPDQYEDHGDYTLAQLPETGDFWDQAWATVGVAIMPLYDAFAPADG